MLFLRAKIVLLLEMSKKMCLKHEEIYVFYIDFLMFQRKSAKDE